MQISKNVTIIDIGFHTMQISTTCNSSLKYYLIITNNCDRAVTEKGIFYLLEFYLVGAWVNAGIQNFLVPVQDAVLQ